LPIIQESTGRKTGLRGEERNRRENGVRWGKNKEIYNILYTSLISMHLLFVTSISSLEEDRSVH
jgi:hypothetical protein